MPKRLLAIGTADRQRRHRVFLGSGRRHPWAFRSVTRGKVTIIEEQAGAGALLGVGIFLAGIPIFRLGRRATARNRATRCGVEGP